MVLIQKAYINLAAAVLGKAITDYKNGDKGLRRDVNMFLNSKNLRGGPPTFPLFCGILNADPDALSAEIMKKLQM